MAFVRCFVFLVAMVLIPLTEPLHVPPQVNKPPTIVVQSPEVVYAMRKLRLELRCVAEAQPSVKSSGGYTWKKNNQPLDVLSEGAEATAGSIAMKGRDGTIVSIGSEYFTEDELKQHEGVYQCFASNERGTAITSPITVKVADVPYQQPENKPIQVRDGDSLTLPCNYESTDDHRLIRWRSTASDNVLSERIYQNPDGGLVFSNVVANSDDRNEVWCVVKDLATRKSADGTHYTLSVNRNDPVINKDAEIVSPQNQSEQITILRGDVLRLSCITTGKPTPFVQWTALSGSWPRHRTFFQDFNHTVVIRNVSASDEGRYRCIANRGLNDEKMKTVKVTVNAKPYFASESHHPQDTITVPGGNVTIKCQSEGIPMPSVEWRVNGDPIKNLPPVDNRQVLANRIKLRNLREDQSSVYQCISTNKYGSVMEQAYVNVLTWEPMVLQGNQLVYRQIEGNNIEMKCKFFGSPPPSIIWLQDGSDVTLRNRFSVRKNKYLKIDKLQQTDSGVYTCEANNPYGYASLDVTLKVLKPTTLQSVEDAEVEVGGSVALEVEVIKDPELLTYNVKWSKDNVELGDGDSYTVSKANFDNAGTYKASVTTTLDQINAYIELIVIDKPMPPSDFTFTTNELNPLNVDFTWTPGFNNFSPISGYRIEFEEDTYQPGNWQTLEESIDGSATSAQIILSPGVNYRFRISARNSVGWSQDPSSVTRRYRTPNGYPINPVGVRGEGTTPGKILVSWDRVRGLDQNGPGFGYRVSYRPAESEGSWMMEDASADDTSLEITGTAPYKPYHVLVQSYNDVGKAENASGPITVYTGEDVPIAAPLDVQVSTFNKNPTKVLVTWNLVEEESVRGKVLGYIIAYHKAGKQYISKKIVGNKRIGKVENLEANTKYIFTVSVFNKAASGPASKPVVQSTPKGAPGQGNMDVTVDLTRANVTWFPDNGWPAEKIVIQYKKEKDGKGWTNSQTYEVDQAPISVDIPHLEPGTSYSFRVMLINVHGNSTSAVYTVTTAHADLTAGSVTSQVWFIVIMCMVGLLILVVLIIYIVKRKKGKKYSVSENEHHRNGPQPLHDDFGGYNDEADDVKRPLTEPINPSSNGSSKSNPVGVSFGAALHPRSSIGGESIEAFVVADPREFNEDGSFIGQYGVIQSGKPSSTNGDEKPPLKDATGADV